MVDQTFYLPLRSTFSLLGPMSPLCLLLAMVCLQQQWTILCLFLVCIFIFNSIFNCLTIVTGGAYASPVTYYDDILLYNPAYDIWTPAGRMSTPRGFHAVTANPNIGNMCSS